MNNSWKWEEKGVRETLVQCVAFKQTNREVECWGVGFFRQK
jgi:hypothetical protein